MLRGQGRLSALGSGGWWASRGKTMEEVTMIGFRAPRTEA
jgi:hypothetical protein